MKLFAVHPETDSNQGVFIYRLVLALIMMVCLSYATFASPLDTTPYRTPLVEFKSFEIEKSNSAVLLKWTVNHEQQVSHYVIERSKDGFDFQPVGYMFPKENQVESNSYLFQDKISKNNPSLTYRIVSVQRNGKAILTEVRSLN
jgi:hypothetical protein